MLKLVIVQPYLPAYRVPFFELLIKRLAENGIECTLAIGIPSDEQSQRGDASEVKWAQLVSRASIRIGRRRFTYSTSRQAWRDADAVIVGLQGSSFETYAALLEGFRKPIRVGVWGHINSYVTSPNKIDMWLEQWQMKKADHIFAYTMGGFEFAVSQGIDPLKVTPVMNTVSTDSLQRAILDLDQEAVDFVRDQYSLVSGKTLCYVGGLDSSKRPEFLRSALNCLWSMDSEIRLLMGGLGSGVQFFDEAISRGQVIPLGFVGDKEKALMGRLGDAIVMPGRIGLIAVDALVLGLPVISTTWPFHAPEFEYLTENKSLFFSADNPGSFADTVMEFLLKKSENISDNGVLWEFPTLDEMVNNFVSGVLKMIND